MCLEEVFVQGHILTVNLGINLGEALPEETAHGALEVIEELLRGGEPPAGVGHVVLEFCHPVQFLLYFLWKISLERLGQQPKTQHIDTCNALRMCRKQGSQACIKVKTGKN